MQKYFIICVMLCLGQLIFAQDAFQELLFPADFILNHKDTIQLNARQERQIRAIHNENLPLFAKKKLALNEATDMLKVLLNSEKVDEKRIEAQMNLVLSIENEMKNMQLQSLLALRNELNSNQVSMLKSLRQNDKASATKLQGNEMFTVRAVGTLSGKQPAFFIHHQKEYHKITDMNAIQSKDIESISVLKGEAAIETFGQSGINGVVIITLKNVNAMDIDKLK